MANTNKTILEKAIEDANLIKEAAIEKAKAELLEMMDSTIQEEVTAQLFTEADDKVSEDESDDDSEQESSEEGSDEELENIGDEDSKESEGDEFSGEGESEEGGEEMSDDEEIDALSSDELADIDFDEDIAVVDDESEGGEGLESDGDEGSFEEKYNKLVAFIEKLEGEDGNIGADANPDDADLEFDEDSKEAEGDDEFSLDGEEDEDKMILNDEDDIILDAEEDDEEELEEDFNVHLKKPKVQESHIPNRNRRGFVNKNPNSFNSRFANSQTNLVSENKKLQNTVKMQEKALSTYSNTLNETKLLEYKVKLLGKLFNEHIPYASKEAREYIIEQFDTATNKNETNTIYTDILKVNKSIKTESTKKTKQINENFNMKVAKKNLLNDSQKVSKKNSKGNNAGIIEESLNDYMARIAYGTSHSK